MKKKFIEPEIKRIELNLNENIASSDVQYTEYDGLFRISHNYDNCLERVQDTKVRYDEVTASSANWMAVIGCFIYSMPDTARMLKLPLTNDMY